MPELPYVPFYTSDWLGDTRVKLLPLEARAIYFDLLCHSWQLGHIPTRGAERAHLLGITPRKEASLWRHIAGFWESDGNGGLVNARMERVRAKQNARRKAGKRGGEAKANA